MTHAVLTEKSNLKIALLPIDELKPHEKGSPIYLELLKQEILKDGVLKYPIIADEKTHVILDGMHRWLALKSLGYTRIPVILVDACNNPEIRVGKRRIHRYICNSDGQIPIEEVISAGLTGRLMKPRSTRHFFPFSKFQQINYPLDQLGKKAAKDVSEYLAKMTWQECNFAIKEWLKEIAEELEFLTKRKEEVEKEMAEFLNRVKNLNGNFQTF
ncbi:MAG: ParB N-terminal domain-containing protein [Candidatus Bathyarchaeota archaeon]|nr:ParB N-terminal domain-containing protein [Candidatus Bathyarchaeota archaeon A05DMB-5]MDH7557372.1 ParB N-terminal domain-containing protein [Candidatus Bathyarchaeota archaeon]